jgi:hypothetical protein
MILQSLIVGLHRLHRSGIRQNSSFEKSYNRRKGFLAKSTTRFVRVRGGLS